MKTANYPKTSNATLPSDILEVARQWAIEFNKALFNRDFSHVLLAEFYWRDHLCLSWDFHTFDTPAKVTSMFESATEARGLTSIAVDSNESRRPKLIAMDPNQKVTCIQVYLTLSTQVGGGRGVARLVQDPKNDNWKAYTLYTSLQLLDGHLETIKYHRPTGLDYVDGTTSKTWIDTGSVQEMVGDGPQPAVLIIGAGQAGLMSAACLKQLDVPTLVIDRNAHIGDNWRNRYRSLILHDPVWYNHFPYLPFPESWPVFTPKNKLANWMDSYADTMDLNVWNSTTLTSAMRTGSGWEVTLESVTETGAVHKHTLYPRHIIQATGQAGGPNIPVIPGMDHFRGGQICHSSQFQGAKPDGHGKHAVVIGSSNSAHDIAQDFYKNGYDVTMIQRSSTCVDPTRYFKGKGLYTEDGPNTEDADLLSYSLPISVLKRNEIEVTKKLAIDHQEFFDGLTKAGFKLDNGPDGAGRKLKFLQYGGGYYINVGASELIIQGHIKIKQGQEVAEITPNGVILTDGTDLPANEIVLATGFKSMKDTARKIFGDCVASHLKDVWGLDDEGELNSVWRRSGHPGLWFAAGNLALSRYYSRLLALQIKAVEEGLMSYD